jgi:hypothetical protein
MFGNFWQHQNPPPYAAYGQQPVHADTFYNNATPQWVYDQGEWKLAYTYGGLQTRALPDQRITNSWYSNYGVSPQSGEAVTWDWVWDPRINQWIQQPVGSQPYGTARSHYPNRLTKDQKRIERQMRDYERQQRRQQEYERQQRQRQHERQQRHRSHKKSNVVVGDTHHHRHLHMGNVHIGNSNEATYGSGNSGFAKFVRFFGLSSGS